MICYSTALENPIRLFGQNTATIRQLLRQSSKNPTKLLPESRRAQQSAYTTEIWAGLRFVSKHNTQFLSFVVGP